jgi:hypothetical protein
MPRNAILTRFKDGWVTRTNSSSISTYGRREGFLSVAAVEDETGANAAGDGGLFQTANPSTSIVLGIEPTGDADTPYLGYWPADSVTAPNESGTPTVYRCEGVTVSEDDDGQLSFVPELSQLFDTLTRRNQTWLERIGNGTLNGRSAVASLALDINANVDRGKLGTRDAVFSQGTIEVNSSPGMPFNEVFRMTMVTATLQTAGSSTTSFQILKNGATTNWSVGGSDTSTISLTSGEVRKVAIAPTTGDNFVTEADSITISTTAVGTGAENLSVSIIIADKF